MALTASTGGGAAFEQVPVGTHSAICFRLVDGGTVMEEYGDESNKRHSVFIWWELTESLMSDGRPLTIFQKYTLSLHEQAKLRQHLQGWRNKPFTEQELGGFDLTKILGTTCNLQVDWNQTNTRTTVKGVFAADGGAKRVDTKNEQQVFDLDDYCKEFAGQQDAESQKACDILDELPRFIRQRITGDEPAGIEPCFEVQTAVQMGDAPKAEDIGDEDIPF